MFGPGNQPPSWPSGYPLASTVGAAKLRLRALALLIDTLVMVALSVLGYVIAGLLGAWSIDADWLREYDANPDVLPNVPALHISLQLIVVASIAIAILMVLYVAACWWRLGGLPGQRALGIRVLDYDTGKQLRFPAALGRAIAVYAAAGAVASAYGVLTFERLATVPLNDTGANVNTYGLGPGSALTSWVDLLGTVLILGLAWLFVLTVSIAYGSMKRGVHDRIGEFDRHLRATFDRAVDGLGSLSIPVSDSLSESVPGRAWSLRERGHRPWRQLRPRPGLRFARVAPRRTRSCSGMDSPRLLDTSRPDGAAELGSATGGPTPRTSSDG